MLLLMRALLAHMLLLICFAATCRYADAMLLRDAAALLPPYAMPRYARYAVYAAQPR